MNKHLASPAFRWPSALLHRITFKSEPHFTAVDSPGIRTSAGGAQDTHLARQCWDDARNNAQSAVGAISTRPPSSSPPASVISSSAPSVLNSTSTISRLTPIHPRRFPFFIFHFLYSLFRPRRSYGNPHEEIHIIEILP